jgi:autotransporter-associated beta strand protein
MKRGSKAIGRIVYTAIALVVLGPSRNASASLTFVSGSVTLTHDGGISGNEGLFLTRSVALPRSSLNYPASPWQLENIFANGRSSTEVAASIGTMTDSSTGGLLLAPGTSLMQYDPDGVYVGATSLKLDVVSATWDVNASGFGPPAFSFATFTAGGEVGVGGSALLKFSLRFLDDTGQAVAGYTGNHFFGPGVISQRFTNSRFIGFGNGSLPAGSHLRAVGSIELQATGGSTPTTLSLVRTEITGAPPTALFKENTQGKWFDSNNWEPVVGNQPGLRSVANAVGDRALFFANNGPKSLQSITIDQPVTLGTLDVDGNTPHSFNAIGNGSLTFATPRDNAVINMRPLAGASAINAPVTLSNNLDIVTDGKSSLLMSGPISGGGNITKTGTGTLIISGDNSFSGNTSVREGTLMVANGTGSAVNGTVTVQFGSTLTGEGSIAGTALLIQDGHLAPGNGVGTITVGGLSLADGTLHIESDATGMDRINVVTPDRFFANYARIYLTDRGGTKEGDYVIIDYSGTPLADSSVLGNLQIWTGGDEGLFVYSLIHDRDNTNVVLHVTKTGLQQWNVDGNGSFGSSPNWIGGTPGLSSRANFLGKITAPRTVTLNSGWSVSGVNFDNLNAYTLVPGTSGTLSVGNPSQGGRINVLSGSHSILAPLTIAADKSINISDGSALNVGGGLTIIANKSADVIGAGTLTISGTSGHAAGSSLNVSNGRVNLNSNSGKPLSSTASNLSLNLIGNDRSAPASIVLGANQDLRALNVDFAADGTQTFDLNSPAAAGAFWSVKVYAANLNVTKAALYDAIVNANASGSSANDGIIDSNLHDHSGIGIGKFSDYVMIRSTRVGDLDLDGWVTITDLNILAAHFDQLQTATWQEGDVNYDRSVTIADFIAMRANFNTSYAGETRTITAADAKALADFAEAHPVPEPSVAWLSVGVLGILGRRIRLQM